MRLISPTPLTPRVRSLAPLECLPQDACEALLSRASTLLEFDSGECIYTQGQEDNFVNYLLQGRVERSVDGVTLGVRDAEQEERGSALDDAACKGDTARALSTVTILRLNRRELDRINRQALADGGDTFDGAGGVSATSTDWWTRLLRSDVFLRLSPALIQSVFERLEEVSVQAGEDVVRQGEPGAYYYVVQSGRCQVVRHAGSGAREMRLADLAVGEGFGEEALIADAPRNATVRMLTNGKLMRLAKADFMDLVVKPLVNGVSWHQACWLVEHGAAWVDARGFESRSARQLDGAIGMPLHLLRSQAERLDRDKSYVVCGDTVRTSVLAAFLLAGRGFDACYLETPPPEADATGPAEPGAVANNDMAWETDQMTEQQQHDRVVALMGDGKGAGPATPGDDAPAGRVPRDEFAETTTGEELADLIDELYRRRDEFGDATESERTAPAPRRATASAAPRAVHAAPVAAASVAADASPGSSAHAIVGEILRDVESNLSGQLTQFLEAQRGVLEQRVEQRLAALERVALNRVHAQERELQAKFEQALAAKEKSLADAYDRLTSLANRISHQKAEIQQARKTLESMLRTASRVHREVYRVGNALVDQFDHLDDLAEGMKSS